MATIKQIEAACRNGARSRGPVTEEGKRRSSRNAIKHGLTSETLVLSNEDPQKFEAIIESYADRLCPEDQLEMDLVAEMAANRWRLRRAWSLETALLDYEMDRQEKEIAEKYTDIDETTRQLLAWVAAAEGKGLALIHRYEARLRRNFERALRDLERIRAIAPVPNEPEPVPAAPDQTTKQQNEPEPPRTVTPETRPATPKPEPLAFPGPNSRLPIEPPGVNFSPAPSPLALEPPFA